MERSSAFVLLAVLLVIAGCVLFVVGIRKQAGQKKIIKETEKSSGTRTVQEKEKVQTGQPEQNGEKVWREQNDPEEQKLQWQQEQIREEWKEKKLRYENLKEQQRELQPDEAEERLYERREALELAEETMKKAAGASWRADSSRTEPESV